MRIAIISTGGTISSRLEKGLRSSGALQLAGIIDSSCLQGVELSFFSPLEKISEDFNVGDWIKIDRVIEAAYQKGIRHFLITHGTDTMCYSAAAIGLLWPRKLDAKIAFVGSFVGPDQPNSDVQLSIKAAIRFLRSSRTKSGTYVVSRANQENRRAVYHHASLVKQLRYDDLAFESIGNEVAGYYDVSSDKLRVYAKLTRKEYEVFDSLASRELRFDLSGNEVYAPNLNVFVPAPASFYYSPNSSTIPGITLIDCYHSGTAPSYGGRRSLIEYIKNIHPMGRVVLCGYPYGQISEPYASTARLMKAGAVIAAPSQFATIYAYTALNLLGKRMPSQIVENIAQQEEVLAYQDQNHVISAAL